MENLFREEDRARLRRLLGTVIVTKKESPVGEMRVPSSSEGTLIMEVEDQVRDEFGASITIADDRAMSQGNSPFLTIQTLTDYVTDLLKENGATA